MELFNAFVVSLQSVWTGSGFATFTMGHAIMIAVGLVLLYMAFVKEFEPLLLGPIAFGCILANFPGTGFLEEPGLMQAIHYGIANEIFPPLIFLGIGAMTDFGPLLARPVVLLLGAAAQIGVFVALVGAMLLGFNVQEAGAIGIIGGADDGHLSVHPDGSASSRRYRRGSLLLHVSGAADPAAHHEAPDLPERA